MINGRLNIRFVVPISKLPEEYSASIYKVKSKQNIRDKEKYIEKFGVFFKTNRGISSRDKQFPGTKLVKNFFPR